MAKSSEIKIIFVFVGIFLLLLTAYAALNAHNQIDLTNTTEIQDVPNVQDAQIETAQVPFMWGLSGLMWIFLVLLIVIGIGVFIKVITGRRQ